MIEITIKRIYKDTGKTNAGKDYQLTKFLATDKNYYTTFQSSSILDSIKEGALVKLEATQNKQYPTNYSITRIISVDSTSPKIITRTDQAGHIGIPTPSIPPSPSPLSQAEGYKMLVDAITEVQKELPSVDDGELIPLIAEHYSAKLQAQQQGFSLAMSNMVQQSKLRNMGMMK